MKTTEELRKLDAKKLAEELVKSQKSLFKTQFDVQNGRAKNTDAVRKDRKQIARIKTILKENSTKTSQPNQEA